VPIDPLTGGFFAPGELGLPGTWTFEEIDPPSGRTAYNVTGWADGPVIPLLGNSGWSRVARPRKGALTEWVGRDTLALQIDFRMGVLSDNQGLELRERMRTLEKLYGVDIEDPEPPLFRLSCTPEALIPHSAHFASQNKWFIDQLTFDKELTQNNNVGNPVTTGGSMTIAVYATDELLTAAARARAKSKGKGGRRKTYRVRAGDTLQKIAARKDVYGNAKKWKTIAKANKIRDPKHPGKVGRILKIP
jgi:hypothetical protein